MGGLLNTSLFSLFLLLLSFSIAVAEHNVDRLEEISQAQQKIINIRANFEQIKISNVFTEPLHSTGWMVYGKPDFLRWQYTSPGTSGIMLHDNQVYQVKVNQDKSEDITAADATANMLVKYIMELVSLDFNLLQSKYTISSLNHNPTILRLESSNTDMGQFIKSIVIEFDENNMLARQVTLLEYDGDRTVISFSRIQTNFSNPLPRK